MRRTRLNQFFQAGNKAYGIANNNASFTNYSGGTTPTRPTLFDTTEYIGRNSFAEGDVVDKEKVAVVIPVLKKEAVAKFYENNNAGNIKKGTFGGQTWGGKTYQGKKTGIKYRKYDSKEQGLADIINVIQNYNTNDLKKIISKYASDDESGKVYKHYYEDLRKVLPEKINFKDNDQVKNLMKVITSVENEGNSVPPTLYYREEDFDKAVDLYREVREEVNLPIRKPSKEEMDRLGFWHGGSASKGKGGRRSSKAAQGNSGARDGGNPGGSNKDTSSNNNNNKNNNSNSPGNPANNPNTTSKNTPSPASPGKVTSTPSPSPASPGKVTPTPSPSPASPGKVTSTAPTKASPVVSNVKSILGNYFRNQFSTLNPLDPNTTLTNDQLISNQRLTSANTSIGTFSLDKTVTRDLPLNKASLFNPTNEYSINLNGNKYGINYGATVTDDGDAYARADAELYGADLNASASYVNGEKNFGFRISKDFKKGGLLEKKKLK